jgi:hypothetical protein
LFFFGDELREDSYLEVDQQVVQQESKLKLASEPIASVHTAPTVDVMLLDTFHHYPAKTRGNIRSQYHLITDSANIACNSGSSTGRSWCVAAGCLDFQSQMENEDYVVVVVLWPLRIPGTKAISVMGDG